MLDVIVDVYAVAIPESEDGVESWVNRIEQVKQLQAEQCVRVLTSQPGLEVLFGGDAHPHGAAAREWPWFQYSDLYSLFITTLLRSRMYEDAVGVVEIELDNASCAPDSHLTDRSEEWSLVHQKILALAAQTVQAGNEAPAPLVFTSGLREGDHAGQITGVRGRGLLEHTSGAIEEIEYSENLTLVHSFEAVIRSADCEALWRIDGCERFALNSFSARELPKFEWPLPYDYDFHSEFIGLARAWGCKHDPQKIGMLLRSCMHSIFGEPRVGKPHQMRVNSKGGSKYRYRKSDRAKAMRRDMEYDLHLHYWLAGAKPQLAAVVMHEDDYFPEP